MVLSTARKGSKCPPGFRRGTGKNANRCNVKAGTGITAMSGSRCGAGSRVIKGTNMCRPKSAVKRPASKDYSKYNFATNPKSSMYRTKSLKK